MDEINNSPTFKLNVRSHIWKKQLIGPWPTTGINFLVKECNVSRPTAGRLIKDEGSHIKFLTLRKLSEVLNVPVQDLLVPVN